ncbi:hypothetical protein HUW63_32165 [Myxococcus sp. AM001]|nr:hypothetical protein [Myxococcus sp. AM001]
MNMTKTYSDVQTWLRSQGIESEVTSFGLRGTLSVGSQIYSFKIGRSSGGGKQVAVQPVPGDLVWWFWSETLDGIGRLLVDARARVVDGRARTWLDALRGLDSTMSAFWPQES